MRASVTFAVLAAVAVQAVPQSYTVQPISQISDGQVQAPPATATVPVVSSATEVAPSVSVVPSYGPSGTPVVPVPIPSGSAVVPSVSVPAGSTPVVVVPTGGASSAPVVVVPTGGASSVPVVVVPTGPAGNATVPIVSSTGVATTFPNSTVARSSTSGSGGSATSAGAGSSATPSGSALPSSGASAANVASFGGLVFAVFGLVFA